MGTTADGNHSVRTLTPRDGRVGRRITGGGADGITQGEKVNEMEDSYWKVVVMAAYRVRGICLFSPRLLWNPVITDPLDITIHS